MISRKEILYTPLVNMNCRIKTQNMNFEGKIIFESREIIHMDCSISKFHNNDIHNRANIKKILKSSIENLSVFDEKAQAIVEIDPNLLQGTLISRLKKMK